MADMTWTEQDQIDLENLMTPMLEAAKDKTPAEQHLMLQQLFDEMDKVWPRDGV